MQFLRNPHPIPVAGQRGGRTTPRSPFPPRYALVAALACAALVATRETQAGLFTWLWPDARHQELERAVGVAHETAAVASRLVESQAQQSAAQAEQNSRVAALLGALALERQSLTSQAARFEEASRREAAIAAAITAAAPALVSGTALFLGGLAIWAVTRSGPFDAGAAAALVELAADRPGKSPREPSSGGLSAAMPAAPRRRLRGTPPARRLPGCDSAGAEAPF